MRDKMPTRLQIAKAWLDDIGPEDDIVYEMGETQEEIDRCWRCGSDKYVQRCHIIAHCAGGSDSDPKNFLLLCGFCHDSHPDSASRSSQLEWVRRGAFDDIGHRAIAPFVSGGVTVEKFVGKYGESSIKKITELMSKTKSCGPYTAYANLGALIREEYYKERG